MYRYQSLAKNNAEVAHFAPSDNLMINGRYLDEFIDGYRQLYVSGRGLIGQTITSEDVPMRRGKWFNYAQDNAREIKIAYRIEATTSNELRDKFSKLNQLLRQTKADGMLELQFKDELDFIYKGVLSETSEPPEQALVVRGEFTLFVPDPYKKKDYQSSNGRITLNDAFEVQPLQIVLSTRGANPIRQVSVSNGRQSIVLNGNYAPNQRIVINFDDLLTITYMQRSILNDIAQFFVPESFKVRDGDTLTAQGAVVELVKWRDERL